MRFFRPFGGGVFAGGDEADNKIGMFGAGDEMLGSVHNPVAAIAAGEAFHAS